MSESSTLSILRDILAIIGGLFAIISIGFRFVERVFLQKLLVEVESACWQIHSEKKESVDTPYGTWLPNFKITNKLGKKTTIHKIIIEFEKHKSFGTDELNIMIEDGQTINYNKIRCQIGEITYKKYNGKIELHGEA